MSRPRRVLLNPAALAGRCRRSHLVPAADLEAYLAIAWMLEWRLEGEEELTQQVIPNPCFHIVVDATGCHVLGVQTGAFSVTLRGRGFTFGLRFRPGGFHPFAEGAATRLTDRRVPMADIFPGADEERLAALAARSDGRGILDVLEGVLRRALRAPDPRWREARTIANRIEGDATILTVAEAARAFGRSERTLQRLFRAYVGVTPKWMIRRYRLQEAAAHVEAGEVQSWAELALRLGYFDQSHFVNDFTRMIGRPPAGYRASIATTGALRQ